jgi:hypothetical protein
MLRRALHLNRVKKLLKQFPVVAILGARQVGKTTLARECREAGSNAMPLICNRLVVVHAGEHSFDMAKNIRAIALKHLLDELKPW